VPASAGLLQLLLAACRFGLGLPLPLKQDNASLTVRVITQSPLGELFLPGRAPFAPTDLEFATRE